MLNHWEIIRWDPTRFLTIHDGYASQIYHDKLAPKFSRDLKYGIRSVITGLARLLSELVRSYRRQTKTVQIAPGSFGLLITIGTAKYAGEEKEIVEACAKEDFEVLVLRVSSRRGGSTGERDLPLHEALTPRDHIWVLVRWLSEIIRGARRWLFADPKLRSLFAASIYSTRLYFSDLSLSRRVLSDYGRPLWCLSLCPSSSVSRAAVDCLKDRGVLTAAIRTQTTSYALEHLGINTDILFCKSLHEKNAYDRLFTGAGPRLEDACVLSLPESYELEPLRLPREYVLLLGTAPATGQGMDDYARYNAKLFDIAAASGLPAVFKGHNLAKDLDDSWFTAGQTNTSNCLRVMDIHRNRELIDGASLVVTTASTLAYYAILENKPVIFVEAEYNTRIDDEFECAPITRVRWEQDVSTDPLDWNELHASSLAARRWFESTYFIEKGPDYLVGFLMNGTGGLKGEFSDNRRCS